MAKHSVRQKNHSSGKAVLSLLLTICGMLLCQPLWIYFFGSMEIQPLSDMHSQSVSYPSFSARTLEGVHPEVVEGFLPLCFGKRTSEKVVALTIDDCNQPDNLRQIIEIISSHGGEGTLFPIGENVSFLAPILQEAVSLGFEIENHTQSHAGLYAETDEELAYQIWQQNYEVSQALGVNYQMHFLRPRGGDNRYDQRTHAYMRQMGYYGIAYWAQEGSLSTSDQIMEKLNPGDILLFHTTDYDLEVIRQLVPRLKAAGYRMVTLNELYGLPENEQSALTADSTPTPLLPYNRFEQVLRRGDYLHDIFLMQQKLYALGYLSEQPDGCFGANTEKAVAQFQQDTGLEVNATCDAATWNALFGK